MSFHDFEIAYLRSRRLGRLATAKPDGTLQNSPVGFTYNAELGTIDIGGFDNTNSRKYRGGGCAAWRSGAGRRRSAS